MPFCAEAASCRTWLYLTMVLVENSKSSCKALAKGYLLSIFHPLDCLEEARCTWNLLLIRLAGEVLPVPGEETGRTELNSLPGFAKLLQPPSATWSLQRLTCLPFLILGFRCSWDLRKTPKSLSLSGFSIPAGAVRCYSVVGALVGSFSGRSSWCCDGPSAVLVIPCRCGAVCPDTSRTSFQLHTVAIRPLPLEQIQAIWIARWKGMAILKRGRHFLEESSKAGKGYLWDMISTIYYVSIITLTWLDSCIKRWQFWTSTSYHPKLKWATIPNFSHFCHLHSSWKGFDSGIRMQGYCLVQCSGVHQQVLADQWSMQTIWIARWKGIENLNIGRDLVEESSTRGKGHVRYDIDWSWWIWELLWSLMYPSSAWRGETAASRDGNFRPVPRIIQSSNEQHSQISVTFVTFTDPERLLILGSGCKILLRISTTERGDLCALQNGFRCRYVMEKRGCVLDVARQLHQEMAILDEYLVSSKVRMSNTPKFRHFRHLHSSWKGSGIRMQGYCLVQCSGVHQLVLADQWSVRTIWIARWKGMENFEYRPGSFGRIFNTWEILWDMTSMIYYVSIITLTWWDSCIKRWQFWTSTSYHPNFEWATLPSFRHFRHLHSSWKGSGIRMQGYCLVQCSGVHQQVLADEWSVQTVWIARWKGIDNLNIFEHRPGFWKSLQHLPKGMWDMILINHDESMSYDVSIITLTWRDSCIKRWQFSTSTSFHPKFECATLLNFRYFRHLHSSWKGSGIRMQGYCLVQCSGVHQQVLADQWSVRTIWIARWKGMENFEHRPGSFGRIFNTWEILWDMISMIYCVSIITLTWLDSCIKRWQFWTSTSYHPKFEWATLPSFRHFRHLHSSWKGFDSGIRMQGYCFVQWGDSKSEIGPTWVSPWNVALQSWNLRDFSTSRVKCSQTDWNEVWGPPCSAYLWSHTKWLVRTAHAKQRKPIKVYLWSHSKYKLPVMYGRRNQFK